LGKLAVQAWLVAISVTWLYYWGACHNYQGEPEPTPKTKAEISARTFGQAAVLILSLLIFPVAKNSVWSRLFGVSWEGLLKYHRLLGTVFLCAVACHCFTWWDVYRQQGFFPHDILQVCFFFA
jgi:hypothetical protein